MPRYWYRFNNGIGGGETLASNYVLLDNYWDFPCTVGRTLCLIYAPSGALFPDPIIAGGNLYNYIIQALNGDGTPRPVASKYFVYMIEFT